MFEKVRLDAEIDAKDANLRDKEEAKEKMHNIYHEACSRMNQRITAGDVVAFKYKERPIRQWASSEECGMCTVCGTLHPVALLTQKEKDDRGTLVEKEEYVLCSSCRVATLVLRKQTYQ